MFLNFFVLVPVEMSTLLIIFQLASLGYVFELLPIKLCLILCLKSEQLWNRLQAYTSWFISVLL